MSTNNLIQRKKEKKIKDCTVHENQVSFLHIIRPWENVFIQEMRIFITMVALCFESPAHTLQDYKVKKQPKGKKSIFNFQRHISPAGFAYNINPVIVGKYNTVNTTGSIETNVCNIHIKDFNQLLIELQLPSSFSSSFLALSFHSFCVSLFTCVICQSLISMSWRHLHSRQTQGGMC